MTERAALPAGDYGVRGDDGEIVAAVERKSLENLGSSLSDGTLAFQMQCLGELHLSAFVVEGRYPALFKLKHVSGVWLSDVLARLHVPLPGGAGHLRRLSALRGGVDIPVPGRSALGCNRLGPRGVKTCSRKAADVDPERGGRPTPLRC